MVLFNRKKAANTNSHYDMVKNVDGCPYFVRRVKVPNSTFPLSLAQYIIQVKKTELLVVQLWARAIIVVTQLVIMLGNE